MSHKVRLLLDSGAYSAANLGETIDLEDYIAYIKRNSAWIWAYVNLDVVPETRTDACLQESVEQSYRNLQIMKNAGLNPIPVFHQDEDWWWLERLLHKGHDYIGLATNKNLRWQDQERWLVDAFEYLLDSKGRPLVKTHGFGITKPRFLLKFPFSTVDSTTWVKTPANGMIFVPPPDANGRPDYSADPMRITVSDVPQARPSKWHIEVLDQRRRQWVNKFIGGAGFEMLHARYDPDVRKQLILHYYSERQRQVILHNRLPVRLFHATCMQATQSELLTKRDVNDRLLSYYELQGRSEQAFRKYIATGIIEKKNRKRRIKFGSAEFKKKRVYYILNLLAQPDESDES